MKAYRAQACEVLLAMARDAQADRVDRINAAKTVLEFTAKDTDEKVPAMGFQQDDPDDGRDIGGYAEEVGA